MIAHEAVPLLILFGFTSFFLLGIMIWVTIDEKQFKVKGRR